MVRDPGSSLTADQAAARLGVKRQTLYAYVSRGLLTRTVALDGRTSLFDPEQVDGLRTRRRRDADGEPTTVISSSITSIEPDGPRYRGRQAAALVAGDFDFEAVADLLWDQSGPWVLSSDAAARARELGASLPDDTPLLDRLRCTVALLSALDPLRNDLSPRAVAAAGRTMLLGMVGSLHKRHIGPRQRLADQLWLGLTVQPGSEAQRRALNAALVLLADDGPAPSTFAVRVAASVRSDPYSLVSTGLGVMGGVLHGSASAQVHRLLEHSEQLGCEAVLGRELAANRPLPGVGHPVYRRRDPREVALFEALTDGWGHDARFGVLAELRGLFVARLSGAPNIDLALGGLTWLAGMDPSGGELFAVARTAGWLAHAIEEHGETPERFRPQARYVGASDRRSEQR